MKKNLSKSLIIGILIFEIFALSIGKPFELLGKDIKNSNKSVTKKINKCEKKKGFKIAIIAFYCTSMYIVIFLWIIMGLVLLLATFFMDLITFFNYEFTKKISQWLFIGLDDLKNYFKKKCNECNYTQKN